MLDKHVLYVFDSYCGWCYGFGAWLEEAWQATHERVPWRVASGGLFTGARRKPLSQYGFIAEANLGVTARTGTTFGAGFDATLAEGRLVLDSETAALHYAALRSLALDRALEIAVAWQAAFYVEGRDLSDPNTVEDVAAELELDGAAALAWARTDAGREAPKQDFALAAALGVQSFPTLLLLDGWKVTPLGSPAIGAERLAAQINAAVGVG